VNLPTYYKWRKGEQNLFHPFSLIIPLLILVPNLIFFTTKPNNFPKGKEVKENPILSAFEGIGRIAVFITPLFSAIHVENIYELAALFGMGISLVFYYYGWLRYFIGNREYGLLFSPIMGIPVPMVIGPVNLFSVGCSCFAFALFICRQCNTCRRSSANQSKYLSSIIAVKNQIKRKRGVCLEKPDLLLLNHR
jgi:hypothetical protein